MKWIEALVTSLSIFISATLSDEAFAREDLVGIRLSLVFLLVPLIVAAILWVLGASGFELFFAGTAGTVIGIVYTYVVFGVGGAAMNGVTIMCSCILVLALAINFVYAERERTNSKSC